MTNLQAWNLPPPNLHPWYCWHSSWINCSTSLWSFNFIQPPSLMKKQCTKLCRHTQTPCMQYRENHTSPWPCWKMSHIWWTGLLKARGLVHGHRNCHWHSHREPHMSSWDQITQSKPCAHLLSQSKQESAGMKSRTSLDWNSVMQISICILHTLWR